MKTSSNKLPIATEWLRVLTEHYEKSSMCLWVCLGSDLRRESNMGCKKWFYRDWLFIADFLGSCRTDTGDACQFDRLVIMLSDHASMTRATRRFTVIVSDRHVVCLSVRQTTINLNRPRSRRLGHVSTCGGTWQSTVPRRIVRTLSVSWFPASFELRFERGFRLRIRNFKIYITPLKSLPEVELIFGPVLRRLGSTKPSNGFY